MTAFPQRVRSDSELAEAPAKPATSLLLASAQFDQAMGGYQPNPYSPPLGSTSVIYDREEEEPICWDENAEHRLTKRELI